MELVASKEKRNEPFVIIYGDDLRQAMKELSHSALKIFLVMSGVQDGRVWKLTEKIVGAETGMSEKSFRNAIKELREKKYIVGNVFYPVPQGDKIDRSAVFSTNKPITKAELEKELSKTAISLYLFCMVNGKVDEKSFCKLYNTYESVYSRAFDELVEKGYFEEAEIGFVTV